jgi:predicted ester cyclase
MSEVDRINVVGRFTMRGTHSGELMGVQHTGRSVTMSRIDIVRVAGGKIAEFWYGEHVLEHVQHLGAVLNFGASRTSRNER